MEAAYSSPVRRHNFAFSFLPAGTARQQVSALRVSIPGCHDVRQAVGQFGNKNLYGCLEQPHSEFQIQVSGRVTTGLDIYEERTTDSFDGGIFRVQTGLTMPGEHICAFRESLELRGSVYEKALAVMHDVHRALGYLPGATAAHEPAETALAQGRGVCQDYAHIMLSLLRMEGIPARYVTGMTMGEGASHAWVEVLCNNYWYGLDPTNDLLADDTYIRVCCGRDSADCAIIRGTFYGLAQQVQREQVSVQEETV